MAVTNQPTLHNNPKEQKLYPRKSFQNVKIHLQDTDALQKTYLLIPGSEIKALYTTSGSIIPKYLMKQHHSYICVLCSTKNFSTV
jgi:hypothetical protein